MATDVVEVVARFGGTILDVAHVGEAETFRIGTAPETQLKVPGLTSFPLISGGVVRLPIGLPVVERDGWTELRIGALAIYITRTKLSRERLARPRREWRTPAFVLASLIAHVAVWLIAITLAPYERVPPAKKPLSRMRMAHVQAAPAKPEAKPQPLAGLQRKEASAAPTQPKREARVERKLSVGASVAQATARLAKQFDEIDVAGALAELRPENTYNEDEANAKGFGGGGHHWDPREREGWGTVESGRYATTIYDVKLCPKKSCTVVGPIPALYVRTHLHAHMDAIYDCYVQHAEGPGTIVLTFTIMPDGAVRDAHGTGLGETGECAARVVGEIFFKALGNDYDPPRVTKVRYPLAFQPTRV